MSDREQIEREIRELLATETRTTVLSNKLFEQGKGLFTKLATTKDEWQELFKTELFQTAQARVRELQYRDAEALNEAYKVVKNRVPESGFRMSIE
jgi:hypothetical protein